MIKAIFTEVSEEYGHAMNIGQKDLDIENHQTAHELAKPYADMLSEVRGKKVSYLLEQNGAILASIK